MKKILIAAVAVAVVAAIGVGAWLMLREDGETTARGTCDAATYELSAEPEDGALEVTFEVQSAGPGETWDVVLLQDGDPLVEGERTTDEDGELDVDAVADGESGSFEATATPEGGEACTADLTH